IVAPNARGPGRVEVGDRATLELERRVGRVVRRRLVLLAVFVPAIRNMGRAEAGHRLHFAEQVVEHVAPVAQHVEDDPAPVLLAVVPGRTLCRLAVTLKNPIAELAPYREDFSKESLIAQF